jgi:hypothetical protein
MTGRSKMPTHMTPAQRKLVVEVCASHINRFIEERDRAALAKEGQRGWLRDRVMARLR